MSDAQAAAAAQRLLSGAREVRSLRLRLKGIAREGLKKSDFEQVLVFSRPDKLRLEVFATSLHRLQNIFVASSGAIKAIDFDQARAYSGDADEENVSRLLSLPFSLEQAMLWFAGRFVPPQRAELRTRSLYLSADRKQSVLELAYSDDRVYRLRFEERARGWLSALELRTLLSDELLFYSEYRYPDSTSGAVAVPTAMTLKTPDVALEFTVESAEVNLPLTADKASVFELDLPANMPVSQLD